jgi:ketosteroid isomerase-like protein
MLTARWLGVPLSVLASACQSQPVGQDDSHQAIVAQERRALAQWAQGNPLGYLEVDADDVTYFDDIGAHARIDGKDAMRAYLTSLQGKIPPHRYELLDPRVQLYGDIGILTLRYRASTLDGKPAAHWKATSVYRRMGGEWRIVHAHWSLVKEDQAGRMSSP